ncbi:hypothetical protein ACIQZB_38155 [Streptomyces sp. NPDC097727]|uniref:hypothetical protein n=1 Tax=Streptomyces sp. NPDC097727 TaxID=3366092 RepID=UPI003814B2F7
MPTPTCASALRLYVGNTGSESVHQHRSSTDNGTLIHTLTEALRRERTTNREQVHDLQQRLAAAHGELPRLRRCLQEHGIQP